MSWRCIAWARKQSVGSASAKAVLICLAHHADDKGYCWPSQQTIADETELSVDSVQRSLKKYLEAKFVRRIKRKSSDGRRISDGSQLLLDRESLDRRKSSSCGPAPCGSAEVRDQAADEAPTKPQHDPSQHGILRPKSLEENNQESSRRNLRDMPGGKRLEERIGENSFDAWFAKVVIVKEQDQVLLLQADSPFRARYIEQQFEPQILECFRPEYKTAVRVKVLVRKQVDASGQGEGESLEL